MQLRPFLKPTITVRSTRGHLPLHATILERFFARDTSRSSDIEKELLQAVSATKAGTKASTLQRDEIEELVAKLRPFSVKSPARNKLLFGEFEVIYASEPSGPGGPLAGPSGSVSLGEKLPKEVIEQDGSFASCVEFKQFGFISASLEKSGKVKALNGDSYQLDVTEVSMKGARKQVNDKFKVQVLYLGEEIRVVDISSDNNDPVLMVLKRVDDAQKEDKGRTEVTARRPSGGTAILFGNKNESGGFATITERQVMRQLALDEEKKQASEPRSRDGTSKMSTQTKGSQEVQTSPPVASKQDIKDQAAKAAKEAEVQRAKKAKEIVRKGKEAKLFSSEKQDGDGRQDAIRSLLAELGDAFKLKQAEAQKSIRSFKDLERSYGATLKKADSARAKIDAAEADTAEALDALAEANIARKETEAQLKMAQVALSQAESRAERRT